MPIKVTAAEAVNRWRQGVATAGPRYTQGIQRSADWAAAATSPAATLARDTALQQAIHEDRINRGIQALGSQPWRDITVAKAANWQAGVNTPQAQARANAGFNRLFGYLQTAENAISSTPRGTYQENRARLLAWMDSMHDSAQQNR